MLYVDPNSTRFIKAKMKFRSGMMKFVFKRISKISKIKNVNLIEIANFFNGIGKSEIEKILMGKPDDLFELSNDVNPILLQHPSIEAGIKYVFNYDAFIEKRKKRYDAYDLANALDVRTCPYCNRNYTTTVIRDSDGRKITRPQFDHYFNKARHPLLAVSFFNLVPSCSICNSGIKGENEMDLKDFLHPYLDNKIDDIRFTYKYSLKSTNGLKVKVMTPDPSKAKNTIEAFAIEEVYNSHTNELLDLLKTKQYFSVRYLQILMTNVLPHAIVTKEEAYRIVIGTEYDSKKFINRPFSKFKYDILKELGVI